MFLAFLLKINTGPSNERVAVRGKTSKGGFTFMTKDDLRPLTLSSSVANKNLSHPQNLSRGYPRSKKTYQIARKTLFSENELADQLPLTMRTIPLWKSGTLFDEILIDLRALRKYWFHGRMPDLSKNEILPLIIPWFEREQLSFDSTCLS